MSAGKVFLIATITAVIFTFTTALILGGSLLKAIEGLAPSKDAIARFTDAKVNQQYMTSAHANMSEQAVACQVKSVSYVKFPSDFGKDAIPSDKSVMHEHEEPRALAEKDSNEKYKVHDDKNSQSPMEKNNFTDIQDTIKAISSEALDRLYPVKTLKDTGLATATCTICQEDMSEPDEMRMLGCSHTFHRVCIDGWAIGGHNSCPNCRKPMIPEDHEIK